MVTTRRKAAAPATSSHAPAAVTEPDVDGAPAVKKPARRKANGRNPSAAKPADPKVTTTQATSVAATSTDTTTATRRTRSQQTASPLKALEYEKAKTPLKIKRKFGASHYTRASGSATPEPETAPRESAQDEGNDDQGIFFTQSMTQVSSTPPPNTLIASVQGDEHTHVSPKSDSILPTEDVVHVNNDSVSYQIDPVSLKDDPISVKDDPISVKDDPVFFKNEPASLQSNVTSPYVSPSHSTYAKHVPSWVRITAEQLESAEPPLPTFKDHVPTDTPVEAKLREENFKLQARLAAVEERNIRLVGDNMNLKDLNGFLQRQVAELKQRLPPSPRFNYAQANLQPPDIESFGMADTMTSSEEFLIGSDSALDLLHKIESAAREPRAANPDTDDEGDAGMQPSSQQTRQQVVESESAHGAGQATPAPSSSKAANFFSRSISAIKSRFGLSTPTPPQPSPTPATTSRVPPPNSFTEALSAPPTPVGERKQARPKKIKQNPMLKLLTKGVEPSDMAKAEEWAKHMIPTLKNYTDFAAKRKRLETPVLVQDLEHFPSSKPWMSGFGDPLGDMDDDEIVPVWAVVLEILAEEDQPKRKKIKASHEVSMDIDDTLSLNDMDQASQQLHDSRGHSASHLDLHPRRSIEPSPIFSSPSPHQPGSNIFGELRGQDVTAESQAKERETLQEATKEVVHTHNPAQGSFGLDYGSEDEDSTILDDESSDADQGASPLWTQPPPPAPVPAHAPLPGPSAATPTAAAETPATAEEPMDEIERQRQKLMKHTPAKPSRLREAFVPSPSVMSDAGNQSPFLGKQQPPTDLFNDMPDAEDLDLTPEDWAAVKALTDSEEWKAANAANVWPDPTYTYTSEEEELSPV